MFRFLPSCFEPIQGRDGNKSSNVGYTTTLQVAQVLRGTFAAWLHGEEHCHMFLTHMSYVHEDTKFTKEIEYNEQLPFLMLP